MGDPKLEGIQPMAGEDVHEEPKLSEDESRIAYLPRSIERPTAVRYLVLASLCLAAMLAYIPRNCIGVVEKDMRSDLGLSKAEMSLVMSAFFITYAAFQIPTGWIGHIWGTRRALPLFATAWSFASGLVGLAAGLPILLLTRLGMGVAQAGIFPCSTSSLAKWFPATRRGLVSGLLGSCMQIGAVVAAVLTGLLLGPLGWRWLFVLYAVPGIAWAVWFFVWFRDRPEDHPSVNDAERALIGGLSSAPTENELFEKLLPPAPSPARSDKAEERIAGSLPLSASERGVEGGALESVSKETPGHPEPTPWKALFTSWAMLCICGQQFFRAAGYMFYGSWFTTFLKETRGIGNVEAGVLTSLPIWAYVIGSGIGGLVSDWILVRTGSRRLGRQGLSAATSLACALLILGAFFIEDVWLAVLVITLGSFCAAMGGPCAYALTIDMGGKHVPPVFSTMNMAGNIGAAVFPLLVPPLLAWSGSWDAVLFLFAGIYLAAGLFWMLFDSNGTIFDRPRPA